MTITNPSRHETGALERWIADDADDSERELSSLADAPSKPLGRSGKQVPGTDDRLDRMATELETARGEAELQRDPAWLARQSPGEMRRDRRLARRIRDGRRRQVFTTVRSEQARQLAQVRAENRIAARDVNDQIWHRRALSRRQRMLDPTSRLASLQRVTSAASAGLIAVAVAGVVWTSAGVKNALVSPDGSALAYLAEPIFSVPLIVLMAVTAVAARFGRKFPSEEHRVKVYAVEAGLLLASMALNTFPVLPFTGTWEGATVLLAHLAPPVLILVAVVLQPLVTGFLAEILVEVGADVTDLGNSRLDEETVSLVRMATRVRIAVAYGKLEVQPATGLPSITAIGKYLVREKAVAQQVHAMLQEWGEGERAATAGTPANQETAR